MVRLCPQCLHHRKRKLPQLVSTRNGGSPHLANAAAEELRFRKEQQDVEQRRLDEGYVFDYEPNFLPWCARHTATDVQQRAVKQHLTEGRSLDTVLEEAEAAGYSFKVHPATGQVRAVYVLCQIKNANGDCTSFEAARKG